jgi:anaerobic selenocysteine-containing dehydrogenase
MRALRKRGGRLTVIDPARTRTAELADRHIAPRPGTDAALLFAVVHVLFDEDLVDLGDLAEYVTGAEQVRELAATSRRRRSPSTVASQPTTSGPWPVTSPPRRRRRSTVESERPQWNSARSAAGLSTSSTSLPATSTGPVARCFSFRRWLRRHDHLGPAEAGAPVAGTAESPDTRRFCPNCPPPPLPLADGRPDEPEILSRIALILNGAGSEADPALVDEQVIATTLTKEADDPDSPVAGRSVDELTAMLHPGPGYERRLDMMLRLSPYGDAFGAKPDGLTLQRLKTNPHGIDLGPLQPRVREVLRTPSGMVELAPDAVVRDVDRLRGSLDRRDDGFVLIGRRHLRSNNSWMHNLPALAGGTNRCTLRIHPDDATELGLEDTAIVKGPGGELVVPVERTDGMRRGVVSLPHGWGHDRRGIKLEVAADQPGVNVNQLNDGTALDPLSGTAVLNGIPVHIAPAD